MTVALTTYQGQFAVEIAGWQGGVFAYTVKRLPPALSVARYRLTKETGASYEVRLGQDGAWWCECPSFTYCKPPRKICKHALVMADLHTVLAALGAAVPPTE
jgi:hypothetical protein